MILIYTPILTRRIEYIFKHIFNRLLLKDVKFTSTVEDFISFNGPKISYCQNQLSNEYFIKSNRILLEQGISYIDIKIKEWNNLKCFFYDEKSSFPFDIFSASFYLLSRYEEYLPQLKDDYGRFSCKESIAYKNGFLQEPIIDIWIQSFKLSLQNYFPKISFISNNYSVKTIIDVPSAYRYKSKGFFRTIGGLFSDLIRLKLINIFIRFLVILGFKKDPYDNFKWIINRQKESKSKFLFFFLIGTFSTYDKNISLTNKSFKKIIKYVADYSKVGLKLSHFALNNVEVLKNEKESLENLTNKNLQFSRNTLSKVNLPNTYRNLIKLNIKQDYTMGYYNMIGFRASTCSPFLFYDIDNEIQTPLTIYPFCFIDNSLLNMNSFLDKKEKIIEIINKVKAVNGVLTTIFHNHTFSEEKKWKKFKDLFNIVIESNETYE